MSLHRVVCLSGPNPAAAPRDLLDICHGFPRRNVQSGIRGSVVCVGEQFALMLEGPRKPIESLLRRIQTEAPDAGMAVKHRAAIDGAALRSWAIEDVYVDEVERDTPADGARLRDHMIDLVGDDHAAWSEAFVAVAEILANRRRSLRAAA